MRTGIEGSQPYLRTNYWYGAARATNGGSPVSPDTDEDPPFRVPVCFSYRLLVTFIAQFTIVCSFASQSILGASLITMWTYPWSTDQLGWILAAFFMGYFVAQIPAGLITHKLGGKRVVMFAILGLAVAQGMAVYVPRFGYMYFVMTMVCAGFTNGCIYVPIMDVIAKWVPPQESSVLVSLAVSGMGIGIAVVYGLSASTSHLKLWGGWPFNFIVISVLLIVVAVLMGVFVTDKPSNNSYMSGRELRYIKWCRRRHKHDRRLSATTKCTVIPWLRILRSAPVYAIAASQFGCDWIQYFYITLFPLYLHRVRHMDVDTTDMVAGIPWVAFPVFGYMVSSLVDSLRERRFLPTTLLRKIVDGVSKILPMGILVGIVYLPETDRDSNWALVGLYVLCVVLLSAEGSSWLANIVDLSPEFAGVVSSVCQVLSLPGAFCLPLLVEQLTPNNTQEEWQTCVLVMLAIVTASYLVYVMLGSSEPQDWGVVYRAPHPHHAHGFPRPHSPEEEVLVDSVSSSSPSSCSSD